MNRPLVATAVALFVSATSPESAEAQDILAPGTRPMFAALGLGPAILVAPSSGGFTQFKLEQEFGYHFSGDSSGPALGLAISESFGGGGFIFQPGPKFWWDIQIGDYAIYVSPQAKLGYALISGGGTAHAFNWQLGAEGRIILGDRGLLFFRPLAFDFFAGDAIGGSFAMRYDLMFGGGVTF
jgi:hypothetical protein